MIIYGRQTVRLSAALQLFEASGLRLDHVVHLQFWAVVVWWAGNLQALPA